MARPDHGELIGFEVTAPPAHEVLALKLMGRIVERELLCSFEANQSPR